MDIPLSGHLLSDDEPWFDIEITPPAHLPYTLNLEVVPLERLDRLDPRLMDYHARILVSQVTPEDPSDWPTFILDWPGAPTREWRLWRLWVRYRDAPIIGELQHVSQYGWMDTIYRPHWFPRLATTEEYEKTARGLDLMLLRIRRPGHPPGGGTSFESREVFERKLREAQGIVRRRVEGSLKKRAVARQMGIAPSTLYSYLKQYPGIWGGT